MKTICKSCGRPTQSKYGLCKKCKTLKYSKNVCKDCGKKITYSNKQDYCRSCFMRRVAIERSRKINYAYKKDVIETLANLEHEQWAHWTSYMLDNLTEENIKRWRRQIKTRYKDLTEQEKNSDRAWAMKVLKALRDKGLLKKTGFLT